MIEPDRTALDRFGAGFRDASGYGGTLRPDAFGDAPDLADELAGLVVDGPKRATAALADDPEVVVPTPGEHRVVLDGSGTPVCVIRTDEVSRFPFGAVTPAFAWDEGEDDRTVASWREVHTRFFDRRAAAHGLRFDDDTGVVGERFSLVHPEPAPRPPLHETDRVLVRALAADERAWLTSVLGERAADPELLEASGGFAAGDCPGLLARHDGRTAGALAFRPRPRDAARTDVLAIALLLDADGVEEALRAALAELCRTYRWGPPRG